MIPHSFRFLLPLILAGGIFVPRADAGPIATDPVQFLRSATAELQAVILAPPAAGRPLTARAQSVLVNYFDFALLTRRAVGPGWRQLTPEQQQRTIQLLTELVVRNYCAHFNTVVQSRVAYAAPVAVAAGRCELPTTIIYPHQSIAVTYRAEQMPDGWRFYDVVVEGVSLVANYRAQFTALFQQGGADAIIGALEKTLTENSRA